MRYKYDNYLLRCLVNGVHSDQIPGNLPLSRPRHIFLLLSNLVYLVKSWVLGSFALQIRAVCPIIDLFGERVYPTPLDHSHHDYGVAYL